MSKYKYQVQAQTVSKPFRLPLVTLFGNRDESLVKDSKLVNCQAEKDQETGEYWVEKRPGYTLYTDHPIQSGEGQGIYNWDGVFYAIFNGNMTKNGGYFATVDATNGIYKFVQLLGEPRRLVFGNGVKMYYTDGTTVTEIQQYQVERAGYLTWSTDVIAGGRGYQNFDPDLAKIYEIISVGTSDFSKFGYASDAIAAGQEYYLWDWYKDDPSSRDFTVGVRYIVESTNVSGGTDPDTDFTVLGSPNNNPGQWFDATYTSTSVALGQAFDNGGMAIKAAANTIGSRFGAVRAGEGTGTAALTTFSLTIGQTYLIRSVNDTDFTTLGAADNNIGTMFTATGKDNPLEYQFTPGTVQTPNFPSNNTICKGFVYLDGTLYVMDTNATIWGTKGLDDPSVWDPLNYIVARVEPDRGVTLAKQQSYVIALKEWTTEVFYDAGNPTGSPLAPVQGAKAPYGCVSADSVQEIDDNLFWVASNRTVSPQIVQMTDLKIKVISTPPIERLLDQADFSEVHSWNFKHGGHRFYGVTIKNENLTLVYDMNQELWYQWTDEDGSYWPIVQETFNDEDQHILQHETNGKLYIMEGDYEYPSDDGVVVPVDIVTANLSFGIDRRKVLKMMRFFGDQCQGSVLYVRVSDDDYQSWTQYRRVDLSKKRPILLDCGTFYRRAWHLRHFSNTPFRIKFIELQMDIGVV